MFPGGSDSLSRNISTSSTSYSLSPRPGGANQSVETTMTYITNKGLHRARICIVDYKAVH